MMVRGVFALSSVGVVQSSACTGWPTPFLGEMTGK